VIERERMDGADLFFLATVLLTLGLVLVGIVLSLV
jgi:hypothetical protein